MLLKDHGANHVRPDGKRYQNMSVSNFAEMALFSTDIVFASTAATNGGDDDDHQSRRESEIAVTFAPPRGEHRTLRVPLEPDPSTLHEFEVTLHGSWTRALRMAAHFEAWFSACFGYDVVLVYLGANLRPVLFPAPTTDMSTTSAQSWAGYFRKQLGFGAAGDGGQGEITFADCAPYLVVSETSLAAVSARLPRDQSMDVRKFRPNVVIAGAGEAWEEDFWAEIRLMSQCRPTAEDENGDDEDSNDDGTVTLRLPHNCVRCTSINVDFSTGKQGTDESGRVLKLMQKDRRVDSGAKYSPVFGRYGFLIGQGGEIKVGQEVSVGKRNQDRTIFGEYSDSLIHPGPLY
jgi:uncharacterized protein YcbX